MRLIILQFMFLFGIMGVLWWALKPATTRTTSIIIKADGTLAKEPLINSGYWKAIIERHPNRRGVMINRHQLRDLITKVLHEMEPQVTFSNEAVEILMMIASHESHLGTYLRQKRGPALGLFQMEPTTEQDVFDNYLSFHEEKKELMCAYSTRSNTPDLEHNLAYQIVIARLHLTRKPGRLPSDPLAMAKYLKKHWNTDKGVATAQDYLEGYKERAM